LGKLVSPKICVGQFNHQNYLGLRCKPNSLSSDNLESTKELSELKEEQGDESVLAISMVVVMGVKAT
jgi:hypothetical protein